MVHVSSPRPSLGAALGQAIGGIGGQIAGQKYGQYQNQQEEQRRSSNLEEGLRNAQQVYSDTNLSPEQREIGLYRALSNRPDIAQALSQQNLKREQFTQKNQAQQQAQTQKLQETRNLLRSIEKDRGLEEGSLEGYLSNPQLAASITKPEKAPPLSPFEKQKQTDLAKQHKEDTVQIAKSKDALKNIDRMEKLSQKLTGVTGYGKAFLNTGDAAEFDALGLASIEPVLKIFNPVGAIPTQKINLIRDKFAPKSIDRQTTINGKLRALKSFNQQALSRAQQRTDLIDKYQGNPPSEALNQFDDETESLADAMLDYPISANTQTNTTQSAPARNQANKQSFDELPNPAQFPNKVIVNQKTGQKMRSDGNKWSPVQ